MLRLTLLRASSLGRSAGTFTLADLQIAHEQAQTEIATMRRYQPDLSVEDAAERILGESFR